MQFRSLRKLCVSLFVVASAFVFIGNLGATDVEEPLEPPSGFGANSQMGSLTLVTDDVGGLAIDSREAVEDQVTAQMITSLYDPSESGSLTVINQPAYVGTDPAGDLENPSE
jgi:hypothetical protein